MVPRAFGDARRRLTICVLRRRTGFQKSTRQRPMLDLRLAGCPYDRRGVRESDYALACRKYRNTVLRETPSDVAISSAVSPFSRSFNAWAGFAFVVPGLRPRYLPSFFATAIPAACRSRRVSCSISVMPSRTAASILPTVPLQSICCVTLTTRSPRSHQSQRLRDAGSIESSARLRQELLYWAGSSRFGAAPRNKTLGWHCDSRNESSSSSHRDVLFVRGAD